MNQLKSLTVLFITLTFFSTANADIIPAPRPKPAGDLDVLIVVSDSPDYVDEWLKRSSFGRADTIKRLDVAQQEQLIAVSFLVSGFTADKNGEISILFSFAVLDPNGNAIFNQRHYAEVSQKAPKNPSFIKSGQDLTLTLDTSDPQGTYTIICIAEDQVKNKAARCSYKMKLVKK